MQKFDTIPIYKVINPTFESSVFNFKTRPYVVLDYMKNLNKSKEVETQKEMAILIYIFISNSALKIIGRM